MSDGSGSTEWIYDLRGRLVEESKNVTGSGTFVTRWTYTSADLLKTMTYPGGNGGQTGETVTYPYHPQMALNSMAGTSSYVLSTTYDAAGRMNERVFTANVKTRHIYYPWTTVTQGGFLQKIESGNPTGLQNFEYTYDASGNVMTIKDYNAVSPPPMPTPTPTPTKKPGDGGIPIPPSPTADIMSNPLLPGVTPTSNILTTGEMVLTGDMETADTISSQDYQLQTFTYDALDRLTTASASYGDGGLYSETYAYHSSSGNLSSKAGVSYTYGAQESSCPGGALSKPNAVVQAGSSKYCYDPNGNMTRRIIGVTYNLAYNADNRLVGVSGAATATFVYDGDQSRVKGTVNGATTVYIGGHYEWTGSTSTAKKYYYAGGQRIAMREGDTLFYLLGRPRVSFAASGSTNVTTNASGTKVFEMRYKPWGEGRYVWGSSPTTFKFTGQRQETEIGLYFYNARWYDPALGRFAQADPVVPNPGYVQDWDRFAYVRNNPVKYIDSSGNIPVLAIIAIIGAAILLSQIPSDHVQENPEDCGDPAVMAVGLTMMVAPYAVPHLAKKVATQANQSVWSLGNFARGRAIENIIGTNLVNNFPVIDRFHKGVATSIKSIDLLAKTYQNINNLNRVVERYVTKLSNWQGANWGGHRIDPGEIMQRQLILAIPPNASADQMRALYELQTWALTLGVELILTVIK